MRLILILLLPVLAACASRGPIVLPDPVVHETEATPVVRRVDPALTAAWRKPIPEGGLAECPVVARERRRDLEGCYADLRVIEERHGADHD